MEPLDTPLVTEREWAVLMAAEVQQCFGVTVDLSNFAVH
jgi:hypothetical protein